MQNYISKNPGAVKWIMRERERRFARERAAQGSKLRNGKQIKTTKQNIRFPFTGETIILKYGWTDRQMAGQMDK